MSKGVTAVADGTHQLSPETHNEILDGLILRVSGIGHDGYGLNEHTISLTQTLVHAAMVHGIISHLFLAHQHSQHIAEGCLEQQVHSYAMLLTPCIALRLIDKSRAAHHLTHGAWRTLAECGKVHASKFFSIVGFSLLVYGGTKRSHLVLSSLKKTIRLRRQFLTHIGFIKVYLEKHRRERHTVEDHVVAV